MLRARHKRGLSSVEAFKRDDWLKKAIALQLKYGSSVEPQRVLKALRAVIRNPTNFPPALARWLVDRYVPTGGKIVDPCCGYGGRLMGSMASGRAVTYTGFDIEPETVKANKELAQFIGCKNRVSVEQRDIFDSRAWPRSDVVLAGPPYFDTENYGATSAAQVRSFASYADWVNSFFGVLFQKAFESASTVILNVADLNVQNEILYLPADAAGVARTKGWVLAEDFDWLLASFATQPRKEKILVFRKEGAFPQVLVTTEGTPLDAPKQEVTCWQGFLKEGWSADKAWFMGILFGDGNVYRKACTGDYRVSVCGSLSTVTRWIALTGVDREPQEIKASPGTYQCYVGDRSLIDWVERTYGICGPKSATIVWPQDLPEEYERDFIRGLMDSDGSLYVSRDRYRQVNAAFGSNSEGFVTSLRSRFESILGLPRVAISLTKGRGANPKPNFKIRYTGDDALKVGGYLYEDITDRPVNAARLAAYAELLEVAEAKKVAPKPVRTSPNTTGVGTVCSTEDCGKPVHGKGLCIACYNRRRRALPSYERKPTGTCACGSPAFRKGMCDRCYSVDRRNQEAERRSQRSR
jgi:hypothetical protein